MEEKMKIVVCKSPKGYVLLAGIAAERELSFQCGGDEYYEFDVTTTCGVPELVGFALKQTFRLGVEASRSG